MPKKRAPTKAKKSTPAAAKTRAPPVVKKHSRSLRGRQPPSSNSSNSSHGQPQPSPDSSASPQYTFTAEQADMLDRTVMFRWDRPAAVHRRGSLLHDGQIERDDTTDPTSSSAVEGAAGAQSTVAAPCTTAPVVATPATDSVTDAAADTTSDDAVVVAGCAARGRRTRRSPFYDADADGTSSTGDTAIVDATPDRVKDDDDADYEDEDGNSTSEASDQASSSVYVHSSYAEGGVDTGHLLDYEEPAPNKSRSGRKKPSSQKISTRSPRSSPRLKEKQENAKQEKQKQRKENPKEEPEDEGTEEMTTDGEMVVVVEEKEEEEKEEEKKEEQVLYDPSLVPAVRHHRPSIDSNTGRDDYWPVDFCLGVRAHGSGHDVLLLFRGHPRPFWVPLEWNLLNLDIAYYFWTTEDKKPEGYGYPAGFEARNLSRVGSDAWNSAWWEAYEEARRSFPEIVFEEAEGESEHGDEAARNEPVPNEAATAPSSTVASDTAPSKTFKKPASKTSTKKANAKAKQVSTTPKQTKKRKSPRTPKSGSGGSSSPPDRDDAEPQAKRRKTDGRKK